MECTKCKDLCLSRSQIVYSTPCEPGGILAIGEAPGASEDERGEGFLGMAGKKLDEIMRKYGLDRDQYGRANIVRCRPEGNRKPTRVEIENCLPYLVETIKQCQPTVILLVGGTPASVFRGKGSLYQKIQEAKRHTHIDKQACHPLVAELAQDGKLHAIPMPHTSPLAWNRFAPDARKWSIIGFEQIGRAIRLTKDRPGMIRPDDKKAEKLQPDWI